MMIEHITNCPGCMIVGGGLAVALIAFGTFAMWWDQ